MKKIILTIFSLCCLVNSTVFAQAFSAQYDTVSVSTSAFTVFGTYNSLLTTITAMGYSWKVASHNLPADWINADFQICDGSNCFTESQCLAGQTHTDSIKAITPTNIQVHVKPGTSDGTYYLTLQLRDYDNTSTKYITFLFNKWPTSVSTVNKYDDNVTLYPNPAREAVNVVFDDNLNAKTIAVYNLIGKAVSYYRLVGNSAHIDLSDVPSGIYFIRLMNAQGEVVATRKFTH